ncbi:MAG: hypothetical protein E6860_18290 [Clostridium sp.]|uniref:hypothetical protein n=1 Tax=Clostridium TaxID=1485 RepID=UPI001898477E|nr:MULTISPECIES: hypothetical protein [Clostridium]MDC0803556.1 hypothetical protein [Clostridium paraputrificum]MDU1587475.1 hypothetical protein [Clostridium sp.]
MDKEWYLTCRHNRKKQMLRLKLGASQLMNKPLLNLFWILIVLVTVLLVFVKGKLLKGFEVPQMLAPIFEFSINFVIIILPIILSWYFIEKIGEKTAIRDEANLILVFDNKVLKCGHPILMSKRKVKGTDVIIREFFTYIPYKTWIEYKDAIADVMNVHFVEEIQYGGNHDGNRIVLKTAKGRKAIQRDVMYDESF